ncbi:hypothetical protein EJ063_05280 [Vibrio aquaticus]|uniref:Uncharacterized protein n=1 Tax=Vibrio aquaticus TaxID=2496559 RepID=A0A432D2T4_9VIBR|nr:hypothetical protein [Vibrio aquaticus]RTZ18199.1 hypothetical protein EJ063_05280 [Vibrio aquaticus]
MKKRRLPIPLILLTPIVLLIIVAIAGIYRFSLSDEEILAKFPSQPSMTNPVMQSVFGIVTPNPWTIKIPQSSAFTFVSESLDGGLLKGNYEDGAERGFVSINPSQIAQINDNTYAVVIAVSNQGSGTFYYLSVSNYDEFRQRMIVKESVLLGDRVSVTSINVENAIVTVELLVHGEDQSLAEVPNKRTETAYELNDKGIFTKQK